VSTLENDSWLIEAGANVIERMAGEGQASLTAIERLIYCLWVADYGMRNAGDLQTASDLYPKYREEAQRVAEELHLEKAVAAFSLPEDKLEERYFELFDDLCAEIRTA
jgi:hypothetical protein